MMLDMALHCASVAVFGDCQQLFPSAFRANYRIFLYCVYVCVCALTVTLSFFYNKDGKANELSKYRALNTASLFKTADVLCQLKHSLT